MNIPDFDKLGFKTGKVILPGIDLEVNLPNNRYFRNDGIVDNLNMHATMLSEQLLLNNSPDNSESCRGNCLSGMYYDPYILVNYILDNGHISRNDLVRLVNREGISTLKDLIKIVETNDSNLKSIAIISSVIYFVNTSPIINVFTYGHESAHAIQHLGIEDQFLDMLKYEGFSLNPFTKFKDEELIAHVGGFMALYKQCNRFKPEITWMCDPETVPDLVLVHKELFDSKKSSAIYSIN